MKKKYVLLLSCSAALMTFAPIAKAQTWNGTSIPTITNDHAGIGTLTPTGKLHIVSGYVVTGGGVGGAPCSYSGETALKIKWNSPEQYSMCLGGYTNTAPNILEVYSQSSFSIPPNQISPIMWMNATGQLGLSTYPIANNRLSVIGNSLLNGSLQVGNLAIPGGSKAVIDGDLSLISNNEMQFRSIKGHSVKAGIQLVANTGSSDGSGIELYGPESDRPGEMHLCSYGTNGKGIEFLNYDPAASTWFRKMRIACNGQVSIGSVEPTGPFADYKLGVDGTIVGKRVVVEIDNWADNVFESDYNLQPLSQVETFIQTNKHLPEIPSEAQVKKEGMNVGDMNALLLKKIEELTLYVIQQQKDIEALKAKAARQ